MASGQVAILLENIGHIRHLGEKTIIILEMFSLKCLCRNVNASGCGT